MKDYKKLIEERYQIELSNYDDEDKGDADIKYYFLGNTIFDFTTYSSELDIMFAKQMVEVLDALLNRTTFEYIENNHVTYITMCNMPFLNGRLEWGSSIRGAWLDDNTQYEIDCGNIIVEEGDFSGFVKCLLEWIKE